MKNKTKQLKKEVEDKAKQLSAKWTVNNIDKIRETQKLHGIDVEAELMAILQQEIDVEVKETLKNNPNAFKRPPPEKPGVITIVQYEDSLQDGRQVYGVRGFGEIYEKFFDVWRPSKKCVYQHHDWPWSYFTFNEKDEKDLIEEWKEHFLELNEEKS